MYDKIQSIKSDLRIKIHTFKAIEKNDRQKNYIITQSIDRDNKILQALNCPAELVVIKPEIVSVSNDVSAFAYTLYIHKNFQTKTRCEIDALFENKMNSFLSFRTDFYAFSVESLADKNRIDNVKNEEDAHLEGVRNCLSRHREALYQKIEKWSKLEKLDQLTAAVKDYFKLITKKNFHKSSHTIYQQSSVKRLAIVASLREFDSATFNAIIDVLNLYV